MTDDREAPEPLVDQATEALRQAIVTGRLHPGERLVQQELAAELGISRTPLREALRRLEQEGLVRVVGKRGLTVTELSPESLLDSYNVREVFDGLAARLAAARMTAEELDHVRAVHERSASFVDGHDAEQWLAANAKFHRLILEGARSPALLRAMPPTRLSGQLLFPHIFLHPERIQAAYRDHGAIINALVARNEEAAEAAARAHVARVRTALSAEVARAQDAPQSRRGLRALRAVPDDS